MFTETCSECGNKYAHELQRYARKMLSQHMNQVHGIRIGANVVAPTPGGVPLTQEQKLQRNRDAARERYHRNKLQKVKPKPATDLEGLRTGAWWKTEGETDVHCPQCACHFRILKRGSVA